MQEDDKLDKIAEGIVELMQVIALAEMCHAVSKRVCLDYMSANHPGEETGPLMLGVLPYVKRRFVPDDNPERFCATLNTLAKLVYASERERLGDQGAKDVMTKFAVGRIEEETHAALAEWQAAGAPREATDGGQ